MKFHPRRASRDPLKGATLADRQSRTGGVLGLGISLRMASPVLFTSHAARAGGGHLTGMLRVEAVTNRRADGFSGRVLS
ncbi:hypothetical protein LPB72_14910 [Hydrogenophaga crassostreae]|uniref:Uncharacterized protein n=1 Tax=Hydrogenophaga crassostreae TaxID=1763535 RepID=A0A167HH57_9BURK|nr:hypothetical protein [Hydrogenophaga crassostreae]AOW12248.1 hypothetical protein LPB072_04660 [Hydrogenophaga crassostreae]OAD41194.1 hypothetical protein LPB72_14910 [Hydrogenophaga crassostreae]